MLKKFGLNPDLPADPVGDALADVYLFLLRKAVERKRVITATTHANGVAGNLLVQGEITSPDEQAHEGEARFGR